MTGYVRPIRIEQGPFQSERWVTIRTVDGETDHLVDARSLESGLLFVSVVRGLNGLWLVDVPYSCDGLRCWIPASDLILPSWTAP